MTDEITQVKERYKKRGHFTDALYDPLVPSVYMSRQEKELALIHWINYSGLTPVNDKTVLEVGCGSGSNLLQLLTLGFQPENLFGNELLNDRVVLARQQLPDAIKIFEGDASSIDLPVKQFDVVFQSTVFTSILDKFFQQKLADRMWTLVKPGGGVLWYDFIYDNPKNPDVKGVPLKRVHELFPDGEIKVWRVSLAPPISRFVTRIHPYLYTVFNSFPFLRTHVICWIKKVDTATAALTTGIRNATKADVTAIAKIHKKQFSDHLLGQLSVSLIEKFYSGFLETCILLVSESKGRINGFLLGGHRDEIIRLKQSFIEENRFLLLSHVFLRPQLYWSSFKRYKDLIEDGLNSNISRSKTRLLSIAVEEKFKGSDVAKNMIQSFENHFSIRSEYGLSVKKTNKRAISFYNKNGYTLEAEGKEVLYFIKTIE